MKIYRVLTNKVLLLSAQFYTNNIVYGGSVCVYLRPSLICLSKPIVIDNIIKPVISLRMHKFYYVNT